MKRPSPFPSILFSLLSPAVLLILFFIILTQSSRAAGFANSAATWYVSTSGLDTNSCLSPLNACLTVGGAVIKAADGDTIQVAAGSYAEALDIGKSLTIIGAGMDQTFLDGAHSYRVLQSSSVQTLTISDLTIRHGSVSGNQYGGGIINYGRLKLQSVKVFSNTTEQYGGGIFNNGQLTLENSVVLSNTASGGGGLMGWISSVMTLTHSTLQGNQAFSGAGLYSTGQVVLQDATLQGNKADFTGGGLQVTGGKVEIQSSTLLENLADGYAAGVLVEHGALTVTNSTFSGNTAPNYSAMAASSSLARVFILNSTISGNKVVGAGTRYGGVVILDSAVLSIKNSIVANNDGRQCLSGPTWSSLGHNLSSDAFCSFTQVGDLQSSEPLLAPLGDYGGPTLTFALLPGSAAIDGGDNSGCPLVDQRGSPRPVDGDGAGGAVCDIGSVEVRSQLSVSDASVMEGNSGTTVVAFDITLTPASSQVVTVEFTTTQGSAAAGSDYLTQYGTLTFNPGDTLVSIGVPVVGDTQDEADENYFVILSSPVNADVLDGQGEGTIVDDDGLSALSIGDVTLNEGNSGITQAHFVVSLSPAASQPVSVTYTTQDGSATVNSDFGAAAGTLVFAPGEISKTLSVDIFPDLVDEGAGETFQVSLSAPVNANLVDGAGVGTITDDDISQVSLESGASVVEGNTGTTFAVFTVTLTRAAAFAVSVDYSAYSGVGGTFATPDVDFTPVSGSLLFTPGQVAQTFQVPIFGDNVFEQDENFGVQITNASPVSILGGGATGYILNDDQPKVFLPYIKK